jgi:hypothetical protein
MNSLSLSLNLTTYISLFLGGLVKWGAVHIVFLNSQNKIIPVPEPIRNVVVNYYEFPDRINF